MNTLPAAFFEGAKFNKPPEAEPHLEITIQPKKVGVIFFFRILQFSRCFQLYLCNVFCSFSRGTLLKNANVYVIVVFQLHVVNL